MTAPLEIVLPVADGHGAARGIGALVVPVDPDAADHRALVVARHLAALSGAPVHLVAVADPMAHVREEWHTRLHEFAGRLGTPLVAASIVRAHTVAEGVRQIVTDSTGAVVCMETEAPGRVVDALELTSGSAVIHHVDVPVVFAGPHAVVDADAGFDDIVAFVDTSAAATVVVEQAARWAAAFGRHLWVVEVIEPGALFTGDDVDEHAHVARLAHRWAQPGTDVDWEVLRGHDVAATIASFLREHPRALAVMGSHGRSGWAELRLGSVSMRTVHEASTPVAVIPVRG